LANFRWEDAMSLPVGITGASATNPQRPERRKSRAPRRVPATEAQQQDIVHDIVLETAVTVAPDPAPGQVPVDELPTAAVIDQMSQANPLQKLLPVDWEAITQALWTLGARSMADPVNATTVAAKLNMRLWQEAAEAWIGTASRWWGLATPTEDKLRGPAADRRFEAPEWEQHPFFRVLKQCYLAIAAQLREEADREVPDPTERHRLTFHIQQSIDATSPTLFLPTNPAALRKALETGGGSMADGLRNLVADLREGRMTMTDTEAFAPGKNLAITQGKVVYRNRLIELIQYAPLTTQTYAVPLLFIPPWINKFYILDLQPKNSLVRFLVEHGFSVFMISWKNPDASMQGIVFEDYMTDGPLTASVVVREIMGAASVNPVGYCIGGTLLAMTQAYLAAREDDRFGPATFMVSLQDFSEVGDTAVFMDEPQIEFMERRMLERGYLDSSDMAKMFNLLRSNDLIWNTFINRYLMGNKPSAFDLLYWNDDGTRMVPSAHGFYLHNTYLENNLVKPGKISLLHQPIDLRRIRKDIYAIGAERDHIVPWSSAWRIAQLTSAKTRFVLAASGHIAGMINPPSAGKGGYWTDETGDAATAGTAAAWLAGAKKHEGSWWGDWTKWLEARSGKRMPAAAVGSAVYPPIQDAPASYVLEK
jgi:polyhydroxyalkanoate synthase subunit PhaC